MKGELFLPEFIEDYNKRFAVAPAEVEDGHPKTLPDKETFQRIFTHQETRKISKNLEVSYKNVLYQLIQKKPVIRCAAQTFTSVTMQDRFN